jgi:hypothetical protein
VEPALSTITSNLDVQQELSTIASNLDVEPELSTITLNLDVQQELSTITSNLDVEPEVSTNTSNSDMSPQVLFDSVVINTQSSYLGKHSLSEDINMNQSDTKVPLSNLVVEPEVCTTTSNSDMSPQNSDSVVIDTHNQSSYVQTFSNLLNNFNFESYSEVSQSSDMSISSSSDSNIEELPILNIPEQNTVMNNSTQKTGNICGSYQQEIEKNSCIENETAHDNTEKSVCNLSPRSTIEISNVIPKCTLICSSNHIETVPDNCPTRCNIDSNIKLLLSDLSSSTDKITSGDKEISLCNSYMSNESEKQLHINNLTSLTLETKNKLISDVPSYAIRLKFFTPSCLITVPVIQNLCLGLSSFGKVIKIQINNELDATVFVEFSNKICATKTILELYEKNTTLYKSLEAGYFDETQIKVKQNDMFNWDVNLENQLQESKSTEKEQSCVMFVSSSNLHKLNPQKLFNLFCIYGNITNIRYTTHENVAAVQMESKSQVECTIKHLQFSKIYDSTMTLQISNLEDKIESKSELCLLRNGNKREENFGHHLKRFNPDYKVCRLSNILELYITVELTPEFIFNIVTSTLGHIDVVLNKTTSNIFTLTFTSIKQATEALMLCNNKVLTDPSTLKCFHLELRFCEY